MDKERQQAISNIKLLAEQELENHNQLVELRKQISTLELQQSELIRRSCETKKNILSEIHQFSESLWHCIDTQTENDTERNSLYDENRLPVNLLIGNILIEIPEDAEDESDVIVTELEQLASPFETLSSKELAVMTVALENYQQHAEGDSF
ncbi:hypothetical protein, partial [Endozoicomonas sp. ALE010]|uniref:hypothetical protein n=1 Tax=Endozoicomonas sp. ALE010 TaxID=3403081 RepID=UPI003BB7AE09